MSTLRLRFEAKIDRSGGPEACWPWTGSRLKGSGYGLIGEGGHRGRVLRANRVAYELANGPIPSGLEVRHACDNPPCVNPKHLVLGTHAQNMADMAKRGRSARWGKVRGEQHPLRRNPELAARGERTAAAKLTEQSVREIRASSESNMKLARKYGVNKRAIQFVRQGKTWRHVV
jgi:hypothetical protein